MSERLTKENNKQIVFAQQTSLPCREKAWYSVSQLIPILLISFRIEPLRVQLCTNSIFL